MPRAVSQMGLAFVAWTRATQWAKVAFQSLPPLGDFLAVRLDPDFKIRAQFEAAADELCGAFLEKRNLVQSDLIVAHREHLQRARAREEGRSATDAELADLDLMLRHRGVAPVSDSAADWLRNKRGASSSMGLLSIIASFRVDKSARKALTDRAGASKKRSEDEDEHISFAVTRELLKEHGYPKEKIQEALEVCGADVQRCIEHCLADGEQAIEEEAVAAEAWASDAIQRLGLDVVAATRALEDSAYSLHAALLLLLNGDDMERVRFDGGARFRRHMFTRKVVPLPPIKPEADQALRADYGQRAVSDLQKRVHVIDLGQHAGETTGACFWLCLTAGLS